MPKCLAANLRSSCLRKILNNYLNPRHMHSILMPISQYAYSLCEAKGGNEEWSASSHFWHWIITTFENARPCTRSRVIHQRPIVTQIFQQQAQLLALKLRSSNNRILWCKWWWTGKSKHKKKHNTSYDSRDGNREAKSDIEMSLHIDLIIKRLSDATIVNNLLIY